MSHAAKQALIRHRAALDADAKTKKEDKEESLAILDVSTGTGWARTLDIAQLPERERIIYEALTRRRDAGRKKRKMRVIYFTLPPSGCVAGHLLFPCCAWDDIAAG